MRSVGINWGNFEFDEDKALLPISLLSGGEQLKVALLCISLAAQPVDLLLLDEPENHLDINSRQLLAQAIRNLQGRLF